MTTQRPAGPDAMNLQSYDAIAARWDGVRTTLSEKEARFLAAFADALPPASRVLDLGCGTGRPIAERLVALGHGVLGVDGSGAMLAFARARMPEQTWLQAPLETFIPPGGFDGAVAWDSIPSFTCRARCTRRSSPGCARRCPEEPRSR